MTLLNSGKNNYVDNSVGSRIGLMICLAYFVTGVLWILFSDRVAAILATDMNELVLINTYKGWGFVFITTLLLYTLIRYFLRQILAANKQLFIAHQELEATYEQLAASEEELRQQLDELQQQDRALLISENNYRLLFDNMLNAFALFEVICDAVGKPVDYRFLAVNPAFERLTGLKADIVGKTISTVLPLLESYWLQVFGEVALDSMPRALTQFLREINRFFEVEIYCPEAGKMAVQFLDCTERVNYQKRIEHMAFYDALTGLPNRYFLREKLCKAVDTVGRTSSSLAVILIDLDDFKLVNDTLGHFAGDELLKVVSERLLAVLPTGDTAARLGGDEFMVIVESAQQTEEVSAIAQRLIDAVGEPWHYDNMTFHLSCKMGIALLPDGSRDAESLMKQADIAMYKAKELGKGYYQYYMSDMEVQLSRRMEMEAELYQAVEEEQFVLYYQPQVDCEGKIIGVEALIRWQHPLKGVIPPLDFIPIAEETGLITRIGDWVLREACRQSKMWEDAGLPPLFMAVNLSARQFHQQELVASIAKAVKESGIKPQTLILEITETVAMKNADYTVHVLQALQEMGIGIALDDFGVGYSSLLYLKRFPINSLKIDRSFIHDIPANPEGAFITQTILALAKSLSVVVVAEGVETPEQLTFLRNLHCDSMQGYLFSKPLPTAEISKLLANPQWRQ